MKSRVMVGAGALVLMACASACTPKQIADWQAWHAQDPAAAEAFAAQPDVQASLIQDWDHDGVIEPDNAPKPQQPARTTSTRSSSNRSQSSSSSKPATTTRSNSGSSRGASGVNWDAVARCESGGQWGHGQVTNSVGTFSGGLMIMNSAWRQFGGTEFAPTAGQASKGQQIIVAERIAARVGADRAWQCPTPRG